MTNLSAIYTLSVVKHPLLAAKLALRRWVILQLRAMLLRHDQTATNPVTRDFDGGDIPPELRHFQAGEVLPWKGVRFRVGKVVGGELPCVILVPAGVTHGTKLRTMRAFREKARSRVS